MNQCKAQQGKWDNIKKKCHFDKKKGSSPKPKYTFSRVIMALLIICLLGATTILFTEVGTIMHELAGHTLFAKMLGCKTNWHSDTYTGQTEFDDCILMQKTDITCDSDAYCNDGKTSTNDRCINSKCVHENKAVNIIIGISAIFIVFFLALAIWIFLDKDSFWRILAIIIMLYSCIPSAFPTLPGSDMAYIVEQGFPIWLAWILYTLMAGIFMWLLVNEVTDKPFFKRWFE